MSAILLTTLLMPPASAPQCKTDPAPFQHGEKLTFLIKWLFIPAGVAVMEVSTSHDEHTPSDAAYRFILTAKTYPAVDLIYKYRERVDSFVSADVQNSLLYKKFQEGGTKRDVVVDFDWDKKQARYSNFGEAREPIQIEPGTLDPLSAFYFIRRQTLKEGLIIERPVTDGKKTVIGRAKVLKKERLKINGRTHDAFKIEPELRHVKGVFEKSKNAKMHIWVTADERKLPLKIKSKVVVGSFVAELMGRN
jgi:hypothetical protein